MQEIILVALLCLYPATLICILLAYSKGYARGAKDIVDIDTEYDRKFKEIIVDFIVGNYERRTGMQEDITYCANTDCKNVDCDRNPNNIRQPMPHNFASLEGTEYCQDREGEEICRN